MKILLLNLFSWIFFLGSAPCLPASVCLNMIVKNESEVIEQCLLSVKPLIDYWVIVDTGSTDGTQAVIKNLLKDIPGELHELPWVNFAHNRNEALQLAKGKGDYLLLIDADECLEYDENFVLPDLNLDCYQITVRAVGSVDCLRPTFISTKLPWKWSGVLHESLDCTIAKQIGFIKEIVNFCNINPHTSGRGKDPQKYLKDAAVFEEALKHDPENSRYVFYLAQSYAAGGEPELALKNYEKRASMPSSDIQETFFALYNVGKIKENKGDLEGALKKYLQSYEFHPRAEALFRAAVIFRKMGNPSIGYLLTKEALTIPKPNENCVEYLTYDHGILIEFVQCALLTKRWKEGFEGCQKLLNNPHLPQEYLPPILANYELAKKNLSSKQKD